MVIKFGKRESQERRNLLASHDGITNGPARDNGDTQNPLWCATTPPANELLSCVSAAFQHVRENLEELNGKAGVEDKDLIFLKGLMDSPILSSLVKVSSIDR